MCRRPRDSEIVVDEDTTGKQLKTPGIGEW